MSECTRSLEYGRRFRYTARNKYQRAEGIEFIVCVQRSFRKRRLGPLRRVRPDHIGVLVLAFPSLDFVSIGEDATFEVDAIILAIDLGVKANPISPLLVVPLLGSEVVVALPNFHTNTVRGVGTSVETKVGPCHTDFGAATDEDPPLGRGAVAIVNLNGCAIGEDAALDIEALVGVSASLQGSSLSLSGECPVGAERDVPLEGHTLLSATCVHGGRRGACFGSRKGGRAGEREALVADGGPACNGNAQSPKRFGATDMATFK